MVQFDFATPLGVARITETNGFISSISVADKQTDIQQQTSPAILLTIQQLEEYFAGKRKIFDLPIKQEGTLFQQDVWLTLMNIPYGKTISYARQAEIMRNPLAIRAIAAANGKNHLWVSCSVPQGNRGQRIINRVCWWPVAKTMVVKTRGYSLRHRPNKFVLVAANL